MARVRRQPPPPPPENQLEALQTIHDVAAEALACRRPVGYLDEPRAAALDAWVEDLGGWDSLADLAMVAWPKRPRYPRRPASFFLRSEAEGWISDSLDVDRRSDRRNRIVAEVAALALQKMSAQ